MIDPSDFLPEPPWMGPPVPRFVRKRTTIKLCRDMIDMLRAQQRKDVIIEEFAHFTNDELESIVQYLQKQIKEI